MKPDAITNENVMATDYSRTERLRFLSAIPREKFTNEKNIPRYFVNDAYMQDVSAIDRRSVKAQLAGHGDYRAPCWNLYCYLSRLLHRDKSLEQQMFDFHRRHHRWTIDRMTFSLRLRDLYQAIRRPGFWGSIRSVIGALIKSVATRAWRIK
jgi:hypothetical protein